MVEARNRTGSALSMSGAPYVTPLSAIHLARPPRRV
jgi:hypothetical protein